MADRQDNVKHRVVVGGVDTHGETHHAAVVDEVGRHLADQEFEASPSGYRRLLVWLGSFGRLDRVGVEGTGAYGAALARMLRQAGVTVVEVDRPDRKVRRLKGKSDPIDAYAAAEAALSGRAAGTPKSRAGRIEAIRTLRVTRRSAVKARTQAINQLRALLISGPAELREQLRGLPTTALAACARLRPGTDLAHPGRATKAPCVDWPADTSNCTPRSASSTPNSLSWSPPRRPTCWSFPVSASRPPGSC
jgi:transposase